MVRVDTKQRLRVRRARVVRESDRAVVTQAHLINEVEPATVRRPFRLSSATGQNGLTFHCLKEERHRKFVLTRAQEPIYLDASPLAASHLDQQHARIRELLGFSPEFVLHSLRHSFGTRFGEVADVFTIMTVMGHSSTTISQRYVHPSTETVELAFEYKIAMDRRRVPTVVPTVQGTEIAAAD